MRVVKRFRKDAFLLIELIVAVSILSIGLVMVLRSLLTASSASNIIADKIAAIELIETRLAEVEELAAQGSLKDGDDTADVLVGDRKAQMSLRISPLGTENEKEETKMIDASASWKSGGKDMDEKLETYIKNKKSND